MLALVRYAQGYGIADAILSALTLAIAALPEEFPVVFSFFLGVDVYRLAKQQVLVRRAVVVENIGRITCICTDKTGTLTEGRLVLNKVDAAETVDREKVLAIAAAASRAETGDPLDLLLLGVANPTDMSIEAVFPFTEDRRREVVILRNRDGSFNACMKGAPETVLDLCALSDEARVTWRQRTQDLAASGHKVIGVASIILPHWGGTEPDADFQMVGLLGFSDPVRPGVSKAVTVAHQPG